MIRLMIKISTLFISCLFLMGAGYYNLGAFVQLQKKTPPVLTILDPPNNQSISTTSYTYYGTCEIGSGNVSISYPAGASGSASVACSAAGAFKIDVTFSSTGSLTITSTQTDRWGNSGNVNATVNVITNPCPANFAYVTADANYPSTLAFCVAKYEMKNVGGVATSQVGLAPWASQDRATANSKCTALGAGYDMISNEQWQVIARNMEQRPFNWSGEKVGTGGLPRGHSDNNPNSAQAADVDTNPYYATGQSSASPYNTSGAGAGGWEQRRTFLLSTGETIWDFAGNVTELLKDTTINTSTLSPALGAVWNVEFTNTTYFPLAGSNRLLFAPAGTSYTYTQGTGYFYAESGATLFMRGQSYCNSGCWSTTAFAGIFAVQSTTNTTPQATVGFRCVKSVP